MDSRRDDKYTVVMTTDSPSRVGPSPEAVYAVIFEVRRLFHRLTNTTDALHSDLGVSAAKRAVLEDLATVGKSTVPDLARRKGVTRQHIQVLANELEAAKLVETLPNPAHQRSPLLEVTGSGRRMFETIRARERRILALVASKIGQRDLHEVLAVLRVLGDLAEKFAPGYGPRTMSEPDSIARRPRHRRST
jgi:DNA-binding MarR family transcriptional regulator